MSIKGDVEDTEKDLSDSVVYASIRSSMVMRRQPSMMAIRPWSWCRQSCQSSRRLGRAVRINGHGLGGSADFPVTDQPPVQGLTCLLRQEPRYRAGNASRRTFVNKENTHETIHLLALVNRQLSREAKSCTRGER
jgi:hypothetical protein